MKKLFISLIVVALGLPLSAQEKDPAETVVVVYNNRLPESRELANYYAKRRNIPGDNIVGLRLPTEEVMSRSDFDRRLQNPLIRALEKKELLSMKLARYAEPNPTGQPMPPKIESSIRYIVLCYGVPLKIKADPDVEEFAAKAKLPEPLQRDYAAVDSELAALPLRSLDPVLTGPMPNAAYGTTNRVALSPTNGVFMVTRLDGPTVEIARGLVDKALIAERDGLWGRAYIDTRNIQEGEYKLGDDWMNSAAQVCRSAGMDTDVNTRPETFPIWYPMSHIGIYAGWYDGDASGPFSLPRVEFMPGAFAYHLHSFSASTIRNAESKWVGPLLAKGATATLGCVYEPYLQFTPNISVLIHRLFAGYTFGEAAYAANNVLSWQTTVVGDPLYRPFKHQPTQLHEQLMADRSPYIPWSHLRFINYNLLRGAKAGDVLEYVKATPNIIGAAALSAPLTEKLAELHLHNGDLQQSVDSLEKALITSDSRQQKKRILEIAAGLYQQLGQPDRALAKLMELTDKHPETINRLEIYQSAEALAKSLGDDAALARIKKEITRLTPAGAEGTATQ